MFSVILTLLFVSAQSVFAYDIKKIYKDIYKDIYNNVREKMLEEKNINDKIFSIESGTVLANGVVTEQKNSSVPVAEQSLDTHSYLSSYKASSQLLGSRIPAIMYHKITDNPAEANDFIVTGEMLRQDFEEMKRRGYTPVLASEYFDAKGTVNPVFGARVGSGASDFFSKYPKPIIITFDDGYKGIYTHALPLMKEFGFKANFYICGQLIDNKYPEYCTWDEIKELHESGLAEIGNHTYSLHAYSKDQLKDYYTYNTKDAVNDIVRNNDAIKNITGADTNIISFPYGLYDTVIMKRLSSAGYSGFISTDYRVNTLNDNQNAMGRFNRPASFTSKEFFDLVEKY